MTRNDKKQYIKNQLEQYLSDKGINTRQLFHCLNPDHEDNHPSMSLDRASASGPHCKCFSCNAYYDIFDLIGIDYGLSDARQIFQKAYELYGLSDDNTDADYSSVTKSGNKNYNTSLDLEDNAMNDKTTTLKPNQETSDFTASVEAAHKELLENPDALQHFQERGLSMDIVQKYHLGYDHEGYNHMVNSYPNHHSGGGKVSLYKYIFPFIDENGKYTYFLSEIEDRAQVDAYNDKYRKIKDLQAKFFNERYLIKNTPEVIFICEGIYDALSVEDVAGHAIALTGTAYRRFLHLCKQYNPKTKFVLSLDNDDAGRNATDIIAKELDAIGIDYTVAMPESTKDFNEALQKDREGFSDYIKNIVADITTGTAEDDKEAYLRTSAAYCLQDFIDDIERSKTAICYPTGFDELDKLLDGGLYPGLYFVGAISSLGKTTFCLQTADNIAASGKDVMVFSLEMSKKELIAKSISRLSVQQSKDMCKTTEKAKTVRDILTGTRYLTYSDDEKRVIVKSIEQYSLFAEHLYLKEGVGDIGVEQIRAAIKKHINITGNYPVIVIDYIQILSPYNVRATDKQNTDKAVLELKRISRDFNIPIIGISSFNRDNYTAPVNLASFKESGAIEYTSDVLIGLQYDGMDYIEDDTDSKARTKRIRELLDNMAQKGRKGEVQQIQFAVLKNRNGGKGSAVLDYLPKYNYFSNRDISKSEDRFIYR